MILMTEQNIILAVIGCVGLLSTLAVYSRANRAVTKYKQLQAEFHDAYMQSLHKDAPEPTQPEPKQPRKRTKNDSQSSAS